MSGRFRAVLCDHAHMWREKDPSGRIVLVCDRCGHRVPMISRSEAEIAAMRAHFPDPPAMTARKAGGR